MIALHARFVLFGPELEVVENGFIELDREGVVTGLGRQPPTVNYARLGNVLVMPSFVNSHVHLLDLPILDLDDYYIDDLVGGVHSVKYVSIAKLMKRLDKYVGKVYEVLKSYGWGCIMPFVEYGALTYRVVKKAADSFGIDTVILGELTPGSTSLEELHVLAKTYDGVAIISPLAHDEDFLLNLKNYVKIPTATHVSETEECHEEGDLELALRSKFDVLVHLTTIVEEDVVKLRHANVMAVICPRANAFFSRAYPPIDKLIDLKPCVGTDNIFAVEPDPFREVEFAYRMGLIQSANITDRQILSMVTVWPREHMDRLFPGKCRGGMIELGAELNAIALLLKYDNVKDPVKYVVRRGQASDIVMRISRGRVDLIRRGLP